MPSTKTEVFLLFILFFCFILCFQLDACAHPFFDELRDLNTHLPNGRPLPLVDFTLQGTSYICLFLVSFSITFNNVCNSISCFSCFIFSCIEFEGLAPELVQRLIPEYSRK
jgi:hypothetical protein